MEFQEVNMLQIAITLEPKEVITYIRRGSKCSSPVSGNSEGTKDTRSEVGATGG